MGESTFWNDQDAAKLTIDEIKTINSVLKPLESLSSQADDLQALMDLALEAGDDSLDEDISQAVKSGSDDFESFELQSLLSGPNDHCNAFMTPTGADQSVWLGR